jgi:hypothetical protein
MWYVLPDSSKQYPLTIERVNKIRSLNNQNIVPDELEAVEVVSGKPKEVEPEFVDVVGHITLKSLEKADKKRQQKGRDQRQQQKGTQGNRPLPTVNKQLPRGPQAQGPQKPAQQQKPPQQQQQQRPPQKRTQQPRPPGQQQQQRGTNQQRPPQQRRPPNPPKSNDPQKD